MIEQRIEQHFIDSADLKYQAAQALSVPVAAAEPVAVEAPLTDAELAVAAQVHVGALPCELGKVVRMEPAAHDALTRNAPSARKPSRLAAKLSE